MVSSFRMHSSSEDEKDSEEETYDPRLNNWIKCARGLHFVQNGLQSFVDEEISDQHKSILRSLKRMSLVHCQLCCSKSPSASSCVHVKLKCDQCSHDHCAQTISIQCNKCSLVECQTCQEIFCSQCSLSSHVLSLCDCSAATIQPSHRRRNCRYGGKGRCNCSKRTAKACRLDICGDIYDQIINQHAMKDPMFSYCDPRLWLRSPWEIGKCFLSTPVQQNAQSRDIDAAGLLSICINNIGFHGKIQAISNFESVSILCQQLKLNAFNVVVYM